MHDPSRPVRYVMAVLAIAAPILFLAALILSSLLSQNAPAFVHMILAAGIMPLIMGAMIYFTPVLTHSRAPSRPVLLLPGLAMLAGVWVTVSLFRSRDLIFMAALLAMLAASSLLGWIGHRARTALGRPHPGLRWYLMALVSLLVGLLAISSVMFWPEHWRPLRRFHLHMNIFGFIGLTAVSTLRVLLPTVAGYAEPAARERLRRDLYPMVFGVFLMAAGSAWWVWLVWPGIALWLMPLARFAAPLVSRWREDVWGWHRPGASLGLAVFGLMAVLVSGGFHAVGVLPADSALPLFFYIFLFPLVTGAVSYLLPVWIWPLRNTPAYEASVGRLAWGSGAHTCVFLMAGLMVLGGLPGAVYLAGAAMAFFLAQMIWAIFARFSPQTW